MTADPAYDSALAAMAAGAVTFSADGTANFGDG
jgi:hypothetical protein